MITGNVSLMNRLNKTESNIFAPCMIFLLLKDLLFQNLFIFTAAGVTTIFLSFRTDRPGQTVSTLFAIPSASFGCITLRTRHLVQLLG